MSSPPFPGMDELLQRLLDDQLQPEEMGRLQQAMREDPRVRDYYIDSMLASAVLRRSSQVTGEVSASDLIHALSSDLGCADTRRLVRRAYWVAAVLVFGFLTFLSVIVFHNGGERAPLGRLVGTYDARWEGLQPLPDGPVHAGQYDLREGAAKMRLGQGRGLLLEAPCQIELRSLDEVSLTSGRVVVEVSSAAKGFRVRTPTAVITDLGTEFGVIAHTDGSTEVHVLKGRISVTIDPDKAARPASLVAGEGQATTVDPTGQSLRGGLDAHPDLFLLQLPSSIRHEDSSERVNLADIVGGGDGRGSGTMDSGIDLGTGEAFREPATTIRRARQSEFLETPQFYGVDGVFVPNGALGPVVISSTGLTFSECPDTLGSYYGGPANSGNIYDIPSQQIYTARLNGLRFGTLRHPALNLHANAGITFDLGEIRQRNPDTRIERLTAVCGIPKDLPQWPFSPADVWVLLDGVVHLQLRYWTSWSVVKKVDVPIPAETRFLTLVSTCYGRADYSWIFFGDPFLESGLTVPAEAEH